MFFFLISCNNKSTEECKTDVRAYEFGREMESWVYLRSSGLSLNDAIFEYWTTTAIRNFGANNYVN